MTETIDKTNKLGVKYGDNFGDNLFDYNLNEKKRSAILDYAKSKDVKIISTGVLFPKTGTEWEGIFSFAKDMGMEYITAGPTREDWDMVEALAEQYKIKVSTHNHPSERLYWNPEILLGNIQNRSNL